MKVVLSEQEVIAVLADKYGPLAGGCGAYRVRFMCNSTEGPYENQLFDFVEIEPEAK